jgi:hypothetical protein
VFSSALECTLCRLPEHQSLGQRELASPSAKAQMPFQIALNGMPFSVPSPGHTLLLPAVPPIQSRIVVRGCFQAGELVVPLGLNGNVVAANPHLAHEAVAQGELIHVFHQEPIGASYARYFEAEEQEIHES